jgi:TonB-dependent receptor
MLSPHVSAPLAVATLCSAVVASAATTVTAPAEKRAFNLPRGDAAATLKQFSAAAGTPIVYLVDRVRGATTNAVSGEFTPRDALERMLAGSALEAAQDAATGALVVSRKRTAEATPPAGEVGPVSDPQPSLKAKPMKSPRTLLAALAGWLALGPVASGSSAETGSIEGRVFSSQSGVFLERARLVVESTGMEVFTDSGGFYKLSGVPIGSARVRASYTGYVVQAETVVVTAGKNALRDFELKSSLRSPEATGEAVKLSAFAVNASRQMDGASRAINEQRYASNIKTVVSTDEYPKDPEGNVAELMKFLPGISVENNGSNARWITMNGSPQDYVPITIDGFNLASTGGDTTRRVGLDFLSINNLSRVEVNSSPTPESPGAALAGSINMVSKSAFERARPVFDTSIFFTMRDNARDLGKTPGPRDTPSHKIRPGFDFSYIVPVNRRFGFTISGSMVRTYAGNENESGQSWRGNGAATNGGAFPNTTPDRPYLTTYNFQTGGKGAARESLGTTIDFKATERDQFSFSSFYSYNDIDVLQRRLTFNVTGVAPGNFSPTFTRGTIGQGNLQMTTSGFNRINATYMATLVWRHNGPIWQADGGLSLSHAYNLTADTSRGLFQATTAQRTGVTVNFDDSRYLRPGSITVTDGATGAPIDPFGNLGAYALSSATAGQPRTTDLQRSANLNVKRTFGTNFPLTLKAGFNVSESRRDLRGGTKGYTFVGADGRPSTTPVGSDDSAAPYLATNFSQSTTPNGWPKVQWSSPLLVLNQFKNSPSQFTFNENTQYRSAVSNSKYAEEVISAGFLRGDISFFKRRLKFVGGLRAEQTSVNAEGPLSDPTRNVQRNVQGQPILDAAGRPVPITADAFAASKLTFIDRGATAEKEYLRLFPSLNASYGIRENLIARASYYESLGRPNLNQYMGGITLPDTTVEASPSNRITVNNAAIKAWSAKTEKVRVEYYFEGVGQISIGAFRRDFRNFFGSTVFRPDSGFLALYGLSENPYGNYDVATQFNITSTVRMTGLEFDYKQALTFLPVWARGVQVFANGTALRATGDAADNFFGYIPRTYSWGISLARPKFSLRMNWNYRSERRTGRVAAGPSIDPATYNWDKRRINLDVGGEYQFARNFAFYATVRNATNEPNDTFTYSPLTPDNARFRGRSLYNALWTMGLKARF